MSAPARSSIEVDLPYHLRTLAQVAGPVTLSIDGPITLRAVLDQLEARFPMLRGTVRDQVTLERRPFLRFFAGHEDISHQSHDALLPACVAEGAEPLIILGAIAGGID